MEPMLAAGSIIDFLKPDWAKVDKAKMKSGVALCLDALKPATTWPGDFDDTLFDMLKGVVNTYIDKSGVTDGGHVTVGAAEVLTAEKVNEYLGSFATLAPETKKVLRSKPQLVTFLKSNFTEAEQAKIMGNPIIISLLSIFGPLVLDLIKKWLSK